MPRNFLAPRLGAASLLCAVLAATAPAQTTAWIPCAADNTLYESATGALSNGAGIGVFAGLAGNGLVRRGLVRFDVAGALPAGASIVSASLVINSAQSQYAPVLPVTAHRVLQAWGEGASVAGGGGGGGGAPAAAGDATWLHTFHPGSTWTTAGGDFDPTPTFTLNSPQLGLAASPVSAAANAVVQDWLDNPAQNFGWLLKVDETLPAGTVRRFDSRESLSGFGPFLVVRYVVSGQSGTWGTGCPVGAGTFDLRIVGAPIGGSTIQLVHLNGPASSVAASFFSLDLDPAGTPLLPGCTLYLGTSIIPGFVALLDGSGNGTAPWALPTTWPDLYVVAQAAALDSNPLGFVLSDASVFVIQ